MSSFSCSRFGRGIGFVATLLSLTACAGRTDDARDTREVPDGSVPLFTVDLWPGEGIPVIVAKRPALLLRATPDPAAPVIDTVQVAIGSRLTFDSARTQTIEPGLIRVLTGIRLMGRDMGNEMYLRQDEYYDRVRPDVDLRVVTPAAIEYLQDRAEGTCFVRMNGRVIDASPCPAFATDSVRVERAPVTRWWIRMTNQGGASGWIVVSDSTAQSIRREFQTGSAVRDDPSPELAGRYRPPTSNCLITPSIERTLLIQRATTTRSFTGST